MSENVGFKERLAALRRLPEVLQNHLDNYDQMLKPVVMSANFANPWFTERFVKEALQKWVTALENVDPWLMRYGALDPVTVRTVAVVNAGNIPFVGLHDLLSVLITGHRYQGKNATGDNILLPFIAKLFTEIEPRLKDRISFVEKLESPDAVIATGNNNSARYFEYYFGKYPHIIRKNRNGVAILTGNESKDELVRLGIDIFTYFGLGCRNVSKLFVPQEYNFNSLFEAMFEYSYVNESSKYMNNFDYNNSVFLLKRIPFLQNGFLIIKEDEQVSSPISVVHYERYSSMEVLTKKLIAERELIQCIAAGDDVYETSHELKEITVRFGETQSPELWDYADGVDTIEFLKSLG